MPKDEFDLEDPLELNGVAFLTEEDTSAEMTEGFAEEFLRMGYNHKQVLALFRNPHYVGPHMVLANKGESFVRGIIAETFARWGRPIQWLATGNQEIPSPQESGASPLEPMCADSLSPTSPSPFRRERAGVRASFDFAGMAERITGLTQSPPPTPDLTEDQSLLTPAATNETDNKLTDPLGNPVPELNL